LAIPPDGWYSASPSATRLLKLYDDTGTALSSDEVLARRSPANVLSAIVERATHIQEAQ
jgi:hypothetical protein